jgi:tRNA(Ile)-lysidine synthase
LTPAALRAACGDLASRCHFPAPGSSVVCAVSGGADSVSLVVLAVASGLTVTIVHVDHGLRPGSGDDAAAVRSLAEDLDVAFVLHRANVEPGPDLEARARAARHAAVGPDALFGHTADDVAETVLWNLLRGAGPAGTSPMIGSARHPLTGLRRSQTHALCADLGIEPRHDPTNDDPAFTRNRVRHEVLPLLADVAGRDVVAAIVRHAELSAELAALADNLGAAVDPTDATALTRQPRAVARAAVRRWIMETTADGYGPDLATVDRVLAVARGTWRSTEIGAGRSVARTAGELRITGAPAGRLVDP